MVADNPKKLKVSEKNENTEESDEELLHFIGKLQDIQDELEKINEKANEEVLRVEQKYNEIRKPVYDKRIEIIKSIPDFWTTAFSSHPALRELLNDDDEKIFRYFTSLEVEDFKDVKSGYSITFNFEPNPYFEDTKLTKTYTFPDEETTEISATAIKWKKGTGISYGVSNEKKGKKRAPEDMSFFSWFSDTEQKDEIGECHDEVAEVIKEDLWLNPLNYFKHEACEDEFDEEDDEEGKDEDDSDDDEEDDLDNEDEDEGDE